MFRETEMVIIRSLQAVAEHFDYARNCSEVFGYDIMYSDQLKPILIEVNTSPSLAADTEYDLVIKRRMVHDMLSLQGIDCTIPVESAVGMSCQELVRLFNADNEEAKTKT